jgi:methylmalonyl-CoA mutase N-terminal domain/subunit
MERVAALGGSAAAIDAGFFQEEIGRSAYEFQLAVERGEQVIVGLNKYATGDETPAILAPDFSALERGQCERLQKVKRGRDDSALQRTLGALGDAAELHVVPTLLDDDVAVSALNVPLVLREPLMPYIVEAVRARATVGEIADTLAERWGQYQPG